MAAPRASRALSAASERVLGHEDKLARACTSVLRKAGRIGASRFEERAGASMTAAAGEGGWTPPHGDELVDVEALVAALRGKSDPIRRAAIADYGRVLAGMAPEVNWEVSNPLVGGVLAGAAQHVTSIAETTQINLMRIVRAAYEEGLTIEDTAKAIRAGMDGASKVRGRLIARTELAAVTNGGSLAAINVLASATGEGYYKRWMTAPGAHYPRHEDYEGLDGQTVGLDDAFDVGGVALQYPGDPDGPPEEICNCRCTLAYVTSPDEEIEGATYETPEMPDGTEADAALDPLDGESSADLSEVAHGNAERMEPYVTQAVRAAVEPLGGYLAGFDARLKGTASIARKIDTDIGLRLPGVPSEIAATGIKDALRYTAVYRPGEYVDKMTKTLDALGSAGIRAEVVKRYWSKGDFYAGTNVVMRTPNGLHFEMQFHTPASFNVKEFVNHADYEVWRKLPDRGTEEARGLVAKMTAEADKVRRPPGIEDWSYDTSIKADVGITPFREGVDDPIGFYDSDKYARFERDARDLADHFGVSIEAQRRATGVWEGSEEPSVHLSVHDGHVGVRAFAAALGRAYRQEGVAIFEPTIADDVFARFGRPPSVEGGKFVIADDVGTGKLGGGVPSVEEAQDAITAVLKMPEDVSIESLPDGATETASLGRDGKIGIHEGSDFQIQTSAITHEYGHYVDSRILGTPDEWFTEMGKADDAELYQLLKNSKTMKEVANNEWSLVGEENYLDRNYYLQGREMFARAFDQYVAEKSANPTLLGYVEKTRADDQLGFQFWEKDEFAPISAKFDEIFAKNGLLREGPGAALDPDRVYEAMARAGLPAGRIAEDGSLEVMGSGPEFVAKLEKLSEDLGVRYDGYLGKFDLLEGANGDYEAAIGDAQGARAGQARAAGGRAAGEAGAPALGEGAGGAEVRAQVARPPGSLSQPPDVSPPPSPPARLPFTAAQAGRMSVDNLWGARAEIGALQNAARAELPELGGDQLTAALWTKGEGRLRKGTVHYSDLAGDQQTHSIYSDGHSTIAQIADEARSHGQTQVVISDHAHSMTTAQITAQHAEIDALNAGYYSPNFKILKGIEANILADGTLDVAPEVLARFDVVNAAIHAPQQAAAGQLALFSEANTARLLRAMDNPELNVLVHPHSVAADWDAIATKAAQKNIALEVNGRDMLRNGRQEAAADMIEAARQHGAKLVFGSDAHTPQDLVDVLYAVRFASKHGVTPADIAPFARAKTLVGIDPSSSIPASFDVSAATPGQVAKTLGGGMNEVWKVETEDGRAFVVKPQPDLERLRDMGFATEEPLRKNIEPGADLERERAAYVVSRLFNEVGGDEFHVNVPAYRLGEFRRPVDQIYGDQAPPIEASKAGIAEFIPGEEARSTYDWTDIVRDDELHSASMYDAVIGNTDRHAGNFIFDEIDQNLWLIDHGLSFPMPGGHDQYQNTNLVSLALSRFKKGLLPKEIAFLKRLRDALPRIEPELRELLSPEEIREMYARIDRVIRERDLIEGHLPSNFDPRDDLPETAASGPYLGE